MTIAGASFFLLLTGPLLIGAADPDQAGMNAARLARIPARMQTFVDRGPPIVHDEHRMALALQVAPDQFGLLLVVFGDEEARTHIGHCGRRCAKK